MLASLPSPERVCFRGIKCHFGLGPRDWQELLHISLRERSRRMRDRHPRLQRPEPNWSMVLPTGHRRNVEGLRWAEKR